MDAASLIDRLKNGDQLAFKEFIALCQDQVYNTALGLLKNEADAEDTTQLVFIEVFNSVGSFKEEARLSTWVYRITVNKCLDHLRKQKRKKRWAKVVSILGGEGAREANAQSDFVHPGVELENHERAKVLFDAIGRLPENQKVAFTLHKVEDLSYKEIAEVMNTTVASIEALIHRAKNKLRKDLGEWYRKNKD